MIVSNFAFHLGSFYTGRVGAAVCFPKPKRSNASIGEPIMHFVLTQKVSNVSFERFRANHQLCIVVLENGKVKRVWAPPELCLQAKRYTDKMFFKEIFWINIFHLDERNRAERLTGKVQDTDSIGSFSPLEEVIEPETLQTSEEIPQQGCLDCVIL